MYSYYSLQALNPDGTLKWKLNTGQVYNPVIGADETIYFFKKEGYMKSYLTLIGNSENLWFGLDMNDFSLAQDDEVNLILSFQPAPVIMTVDIYLALETPAGYLFFAYHWSNLPIPVIRKIRIQNGLDEIK